MELGRCPGQRWMGSAMRVYYQDSEISITPSAFRGGERAYSLRDIERAWRVRRRAVGSKVRSAGLVIAAVILVQVVLVLVGRWALGLAGGGTVLVVAVVLFIRWMIHLAAGAPALNAVEDLRRYGSSRAVGDRPRWRGAAAEHRRRDSARPGLPGAGPRARRPESRPASVAAAEPGDVDLRTYSLASCSLSFWD
jgi:hypothetical protein